MAAYQGLDGVWGFDLPTMIGLIEGGTVTEGEPFAGALTSENLQIDILGQGIPGDPLQSIPINDLLPTIDVKGDYRLFATNVPPNENDQIDQNGNTRRLIFGVTDSPAIQFDDGSNAQAPDCPRVGGQRCGCATRVEEIVAPQDNAYNQRVNLCENGKCRLRAGKSRSRSARLPSCIRGAVHDTHDIAFYVSGDVERRLRLHYDSLRADPKPIVHFEFPDLPAGGDDRVALARLRVFNDGVEYWADGLKT